MIIGDMEIRLRADIARLQRDMDDARRVVGGAVNGITEAAKMARGALVAMAAGVSFAALVHQVVDAQREFDKLNASLVTATGSTAGAAGAFKALQAFAATTPYSVKEATEAFIKMRNLGLDPSEKAMRSYGNTASSMGKGLNQMVEAVADAATGEFERLKEFGITAKQNGDQVSLTFKGVTKNIGNNAKEIQTYLQQLGDNDFAGGMERRANTLDGAISNLGDTWDSVLRGIARNGIGEAMMSGVLAVSGALQDLGAILDAVGGKVGAEGKAVKEATGLHVVLTTTFEALAVVGTNIAYVFQTIGKDIGAFAAQAVTLFNGGMKGLVDGSTVKAVQTIGRARVAEAEEERKAVDAKSEAILGAAAKAQAAQDAETANLQKNGGDRLAQYKVELSEGEKRTNALNALIDVRKKLLGIDPQDMADMKKIQTALDTGAISQSEYNRLKGQLEKQMQANSLAYKQEQKSLDAQVATIQRAAAAQAQLNQRQQEHIQFLKSSGQMNDEAAINAGADAQVKGFNDQISAQQRLLAIARQRQDSQKEQKDIEGQIGLLRTQIDNAQAKRDEDLILLEQEQYRQAVNNTADIIEAAQAATKAQQDRTRDMQDEIETIGLTSQQLAELTAVRLRDQAAALDRRAVISTIDAETEALRRQADELRKQADLTITKEVLTRQKEVWGQIENTAHDTFISIFDSGKSAFDRLRDTLKNGLLELLYQMTVKQWIFNIGASVGMTGPGAVAQAAGVAGGGFGSAGGSLLGSAAGSLFGAGGLSGSLAAGAGWMTGATTLTGSLSAAGSLIGTGTAGGIMSGIGMGVGALGPLALGAAGLYSLAKGLDHSGTPHTGGASSADQYGNVSTVRAESLNFEKTAVSDATNQFTAGIASSVVSILNGTAAAFGKTAAYSASAAFADDSSEDGAWGGLVIKQAGQNVLNWQDTRTSRWAPKEFADGEEGQKQYLAEVSKSVRAQLDAIGLPGWAKGMLDQLGNAPALADLAKTVDTINATEEALAVMGERLVGFGNLSDDAVSALMSASGGIEALAANASAYYDAFYSDAEKTKVLSDQVADALQTAGVTMPATREAYRAQVEAQLALGSAGAPAAAALLGVASAINEIYPAATSATKSLQQIADERKPLQDQLDELTMTSAQLLAKQRDALDDSNKALFDQVQAAQKVKTAQDAAKTSLGDFITQMKSFATTAKGLNSSLVLGELSTLTPEQQYAEARRQFELTRQQAAVGDTTAQGNLQSIEQTFLQLSQKLNGGDAQYSSDLAAVMRTNDELAQWATQSVDVAQSSLDALNNSAATLMDISATLTAIAAGVQYLPAALSGKDLAEFTQSFKPIDFSNMGTLDMAPLVSEIKSLREEVKALRADQQKQTGDLIQAGAASTQQAAETVVEGVREAVTDAAYGEVNSTRELK